tara:strand:+ start:286 stop:483 length:198 start_codon:yes stop_codon:yes gene_type:complete
MLFTIFILVRLLQSTLNNALEYNLLRLFIISANSLLEDLNAMGLFELLIILLIKVLVSNLSQKDK